MQFRVYEMTKNQNGSLNAALLGSIHGKTWKDAKRNFLSSSLAQKGFKPQQLYLRKVMKVF